MTRHNTRHVARHKNYKNLFINDLINFCFFNAFFSLQSYVENPSYGNADLMNEDLVKNDFELKQKRIQLCVITAQVKYMIVILADGILCTQHNYFL